MLPCCVVIQTALIIILNAFEIVNTFSKLSWQIFLTDPAFLRFFTKRGEGKIACTGIFTIDGWKCWWYDYADIQKYAAERARGRRDRQT